MVIKNILFVHQSADLYGSDKTLLFLVESIMDVANPIVVLPEEGPLTEELKRLNIEFFILPVIKVSRQLFTIFGMITMPFQIYKSLRILKKKLENRQIDIVHSNTLAVFLGAFYSKIYRITHIWHIHEIINHPKIVARSYPFLVDWFSDLVVFNSNASAEHLYSLKPILKLKSKVIHNGLDREAPFSTKEEQTKLREALFKNVTESSIILGLVGRINRLKGQRLLLDVFEELIPIETKNIYLLLIGSTIKSQMFLLDELNSEIKTKNLQDNVTIVGFQKELWKYYDCIDILIVPTTDPESFGLVAVEGMLSKKPVIASNHGGLKEIVVNRETGLLFQPNNKSELKEVIQVLLNNSDLITEYGEKGESRAKLEFSLKNYINNFKAVYSEF